MIRIVLSHKEVLDLLRGVPVRTSNTLQTTSDIPAEVEIEVDWQARHRLRNLLDEADKDG